MEKKCVLVSYGERNKVISIPESKRGNDLNYLSQEFKEVFSFGDNVNLLLTFQKFDNDCLDLEENCSLSNKDKIKAVVIPILRDDTPLPSMAGTIMGEVSFMLLILLGTF